MTKKNMIKKSDNEIGKFWNRKKSTYRRTGPRMLGQTFFTLKHESTTFLRSDKIWE